jgi:hypothetical protein
MLIQQRSMGNRLFILMFRKTNLPLLTTWHEREKARWGEIIELPVCVLSGLGAGGRFTNIFSHSL